MKQDISPIPIHCSSTEPHSWPRLVDVGLSPDARSRRRNYIGGSDANIILSGNDERLLTLWAIKRNGEVSPPSITLAMIMGSWTEDLNRQWFEHETDMAVTDCGLFVVSDDITWRSATLDGVVETRGAIWEAKHVSAFAKSDEVLSRYMPELQHNMQVAGRDHAILSIFYGNHRWETIHVAADWLYQEELLDAETRFWASVKSGAPPVAIPAPPAPKAFGMREVCFEGNNGWAAAAADWIAHGASAKLHTAAAKNLKELITDDTSLAYGHRIEVKRSRAGALTIREMQA